MVSVRPGPAGDEDREWRGAAERLLVASETAFGSKGGVEVDRTEDVRALAELYAGYSKPDNVAEWRGRSYRSLLPLHP